MRWEKMMNDMPSWYIMQAAINLVDSRHLGPISFNLEAFFKEINSLGINRLSLIIREYMHINKFYNEFELSSSSQ